jgi:hypothetical protein
LEGVDWIRFAYCRFRWRTLIYLFIRTYVVRVSAGTSTVPTPNSS